MSAPSDLGTARRGTQPQRVVPLSHTAGPALSQPPSAPFTPAGVVPLQLLRLAYRFSPYPCCPARRRPAGHPHHRGSGHVLRASDGAHLRLPHRPGGHRGARGLRDHAPAGGTQQLRGQPGPRRGGRHGIRSCRGVQQHVRRAAPAGARGPRGAFRKWAARGRARVGAEDAGGRAAGGREGRRRGRRRGVAGGGGGERRGA